LNRWLPADSGQSPKVRRVRGREKDRILDAPRRDCSRRRLCPNPDRSGHLLSRAWLSSPVRSDVGGERCRRRGVHLQGARNERVVRRPPSAKKTGAHQPEAPSVAGPLAERAGRASREAEACPTARLCLFHHPGARDEGRSHGTRWLGPSPRESGEPLYRRRTAASLTTSADRCLREHDRGPLEHPKLPG
jgi:hypothetical protein